MKKFPENVHDLFDYSVCTDYLTWKIDRGSNKVKGQKAGCLDISTGYIVIKIDGKKYKAHNLIWYYIMEEWPSEILDHRDQNRSHNCFFNLRESSYSQNSGNTKIRINNTSGYRRVWWNKRLQKYAAGICKDNKKYHLGYFDCPIEAAKKWDKAAKELFGPFAYVNFNNEEE